MDLAHPQSHPSHLLLGAAGQDNMMMMTHDDDDMTTDMMPYDLMT